MPNHPPDETFDVRKIERLIAEAKVTRDEYAAYLATLEDCAADAEESSVRFTAHDRGGRRGTDVFSDQGHHEHDDEG